MPDTDTWAAERFLAFCAVYGGSKVRPLAESTRLESAGLDRLRAAVPLILAAQRKILAHLLDTRGPGEVLRLCGVPAELTPWISVLRDPWLDCQPIMRIDAVQAADGTVWICELNIDSSVGIAEAAELRRLEEVAAGVDPQPTPYEDLATMLGPMLADSGADRICLLDWSSWDGYGMYDLEWMRRVLEARLPGIRVSIATEKDGLDAIDSRTLVYRVFMAEDAMADLDFVSHLFERAGAVVTDFSCELLGSKVWMAILQDPQYDFLLDEPSRAAIATVIPPTVVVSADNRAALLASRADLFFKSACDFGGHGVISGRAVAQDELARLLESELSKVWIAQQAVEPARIEIRQAGSSMPASARSVLGLFRFGQHWSGILVRASHESDIINAAGGSAV
ncbi:MAG TPA: hypothetical protein VF542_03075, partial [Jatrophihabitans sp.]